MLPRGFDLQSNGVGNELCDIRLRAAVAMNKGTPGKGEDWSGGAGEVEVSCRMANGGKEEIYY